MRSEGLKTEVLEPLQWRLQQELLPVLEKEGCLSDEMVMERIEESVLSERHRYLSAEEKEYLIQRIFNGLRKLDVLQELLEEPEITEIMINGPGQIFVEKEGKLLATGLHFSSRQRLEDVIQQLVSRMNRIVNEASPIVDVRMEDGSRMNVVLPPIALNGPVVTIRRFPSAPLTMERLIRLGSITEEAAELLQLLVEARYNIFISGGTGSGKTTFLNALSQYIPSDERVITIEDSAELQIQNVPNLVRLEARNANLEGRNQITIRELVRSALRQRPDRIIIGEVRDAAVIEMLNAMNTGHDGSLSTGHANNSLDMLHRMETLVLTGMDIPLAAVRAQIASAIDIVVQLGRVRDKSRKVLEIQEVIGVCQGEIVLRPLYLYHERQSGGKGELIYTGKALEHRDKLIRRGRLSLCRKWIGGAGDEEGGQGKEIAEDRICKGSG